MYFNSKIHEIILLLTCLQLQYASADKISLASCEECIRCIHSELITQESGCEYPKIENMCPDEYLDSCKNQQELKEDIYKELQNVKILVIILTALVVILILMHLMRVFYGKNKTWKRFYRKIFCKSSSHKIEDCEAMKGPSGVVVYSAPPSSTTPPEGPQMTSSIKESQLPDSVTPVVPNQSRRRRMPSESICPDDSQAEVSGYDNFGLSTSTLNATSCPSSPNSPTNVPSSPDITGLSLNPLNTTMTTVQLDSS